MSSPRRPAAGRTTGAHARARRGGVRVAAEESAYDPAVLDGTAAGRRFSMRALVLLALVIVLATMFLPSAGTGIRQMQQIAALEADIESTTSEVEQLRAKQEQLHDPLYIERLAREELHYARPGEDVYIVIDDTEDSAAETAADGVERPVRAQPWYLELVDSLTAVGYATKDSP